MGTGGPADGGGVGGPDVGTEDVSLTMPDAVISYTDVFPEDGSGDAGDELKMTSSSSSETGQPGSRAIAHPSLNGILCIRSVDMKDKALLVFRIFYFADE